MKALFIGGIKSGKSKNAEEYTLAHSKEKPIYLATNEFFDAEMHERDSKHKEQRAENFITIEEPLKLTHAITNTNKTILVECVSMWVNNMLYHKHSQTQIIEEIESLLALDADIVFVINDVSCSVVSEHKLVREFVDINGKVAQLLASRCDGVYNSIAGISVKIK